MRARDRARRACLTIAAALATSACARNPAPRGWLPDARAAGAEAFGGWVEVELRGGDGTRVAGELIAVSDDSLWVLGATLAGVARADAARATLVAYRPATDAIAWWTLAGTLSTASHGLVAIFSAPIWIATGTVSARAVSRDPIVQSPPAAWTAMAPHARFPQGMPPALDRSMLRPKPPRPARR